MTPIERMRGDSGWRKMTSRVPLGSILAPILLTLFINDRGSESQSLLMTFADAVKLVDIINPEEDWDITGEELDNLEDCRNRNGMKWDYANN